MRAAFERSPSAPRLLLRADWPRPVRLAARAGGSRSALVIVPPFGYEAVCAHRSLRHLAEAAARAGMLRGALRSRRHRRQRRRRSRSGSRRRVARLDRRRVRPRAHRRRRSASCSSACGSARRSRPSPPRARDDVAGRRRDRRPCRAAKALVREGRALQMQLGLAAAPTGVAAPPEDVHEVVGFAQTAETRAALSAIDLAKATRAPAPAMLVIDRDDLPANDKWVAALRALGVDVEHARLPGYVEMMLDPHKAIVPDAIIAATIAFAAARPAHRARPPRPAPRIELVPSVAVRRPDRGGRRDRRAAPRSRSLAPRRSPRRAVILLNAGAVYRVGPNRLYVDARAPRSPRTAIWSSASTSPASATAHRAPRSDENVVYSDHAVADVGAVVAWARATGRDARSRSSGCARAPTTRSRPRLAGRRSTTVVADQPAHVLLEAGHAARLRRVPRHRGRAALRADRCAAPRRGRSCCAARSIVGASRASSPTARARCARAPRAATCCAACACRSPMTSAASCSRSVARGVAMRFIFAAGEPGRAMLAEQGGSAVARLERAGKLSIDVIPSAGPHVHAALVASRCCVERSCERCS